MLAQFHVPKMLSQPRAILCANLHLSLIYVSGIRCHYTWKGCCWAHKMRQTCNHNSVLSKWTIIVISRHFHLARYWNNFPFFRCLSSSAQASICVAGNIVSGKEALLTLASSNNQRQQSSSSFFLQKILNPFTTSRVRCDEVKLRTKCCSRSSSSWLGMGSGGESTTQENSKVI